MFALSHRLRFIVALVPCLLQAAGSHAADQAAPTSDAFDRPAVQTLHAAHSVLLAAAPAGSRIVAAGERGIVIVSEDGGVTWKQSPSPVSVTLTAVRFADAEHGYAVGHAGTLLVTSDGGRTWTRRLDGRRIAEIELQAAKQRDNGAALKSAQRLVADGPDKPLLDVLVLDAQRALAVGAYGVALETRDGGANWTSLRSRLDNPKELHLYAVRQRGSRIVIAGEQGLVMQSIDGGESFKQVATPYKGSFFTLELPSNDEIVVAGLRGNAWRSSDGGAHWRQLASPVPVSITGSALRGDGSLVFVNQAGMVLGVGAGGGDGALKPIVANPLPPLNGVLPLDAGALLVLSIQGVQRIPAPTPPQAKQPQ